MSREFDKNYWETHWSGSHQGAPFPPAHPALEEEVAALHPGTALDAGAGAGNEASWLAAHGWEVTAVDISAHAAARAATRQQSEGRAGQVAWIEADLTVWAPEQQFDLVTTFYAHPEITQHAFYERISQWVAPGGTLLIVGHYEGHGPADGETHPHNAVTTPELIRAHFSPSQWAVSTAEVRSRVVSMEGGPALKLRDVVARLGRI